jgi:predicted GIY-YIG superfamily endonuclease
MDLNVAGIYKITNLINNKVYIGQSLDIKRRWKNHKYFCILNKKRHCGY